MLSSKKSAKGIGRILREARQDAGLTQQQLAALVSMDRSYISDVERGEAFVSLDSFLRICRGIGASATSITAKIESDLKG